MRCHDDFFSRKAHSDFWNPKCSSEVHLLVGVRMIVHVIGSLALGIRQMLAETHQGDTHVWISHVVLSLMGIYLGSKFLLLSDDPSHPTTTDPFRVSDESSYPAGGSSSFSSPQLGSDGSLVPKSTSQPPQHPACSVCQNTASNGVDRTVSMLVIGVGVVLWGVPHRYVSIFLGVGVLAHPPFSSGGSMDCRPLGPTHRSVLGKSPSIDPIVVCLFGGSGSSWTTTNGHLRVVATVFVPACSVGRRRRRCCGASFLPVDVHSFFFLLATKI
jgi:hypothetical protein